MLIAALMVTVSVFIPSTAVTVQCEADVRIISLARTTTEQTVIREADRRSIGNAVGRVGWT
jgi:hypothetical protein